MTPDEHTRLDYWKARAEELELENHRLKCMILNIRSAVFGRARTFSDRGYEIVADAPDA